MFSVNYIFLLNITNVFCNFPKIGRKRPELMQTDQLHVDAENNGQHLRQKRNI